jgi:hypothetical protein
VYTFTEFSGCAAKLELNINFVNKGRVAWKFNELMQQVN